MREQASTNRGFTKLSLVLSISSAICFIALVILFVRRIFRTLTSCCDCIDENNDGQRRSDFNENRYELLQKRPTLKHEFLTDSGKHRPVSLSMESLGSYKHAHFEIPGMITYETVQPYEGSTTSGYSTGGVSQAESLDSFFDNKVFIDEYLQPTERHRMRGHANKVTRGITRGQSTEDGLDNVRPELYETKFRQTHGPGVLGKVRFSLQYEDKTKRKLIMTLKDITNLTFLRGMENITGLYLSALLLPERDYRFQSKVLERCTDVLLEEQFIFHSRPHNRDFESRTVHLTIMYIDKSGKEILYGESRMAMLGHEIYSQVPTDISIGIKAPSIHHEVGDAQICLSYFSDEQRLNVMVKVLKFTNYNVLDNLSGIHIKAHLSRIGGERMGKKKTISKSLSGIKNSNTVEFQEHMSFLVEADTFMLCTLKLNVHGKHKLLRKHMSLGKIRIGDHNLDDGGKAHWKTVSTSEGIGWTMWHVVYSN